MEALPAAPKPCCVCGAPNGKHCTKCKSRHYCSKACQLIDWNEGGHKAQCRQLASNFQDRLLEELMPAKLKIKEEPPIVEDVSPAAGSRAAQSAPAVGAGNKAEAKATALNDDTPEWRERCGICLDVIPFAVGHAVTSSSGRSFYSCCCKTICMECSNKCQEYDERCPLCRAAAYTSTAETLRRLQKHADEGKAQAQLQLGNEYQTGGIGLKKSIKRAVQLFERAAAQGHAQAQNALGLCYDNGEGVKINYKTAALWYRRAAEQGYPVAQKNLGKKFYDGNGVAQSYEEAARWYRLAAAQGFPSALYKLGRCYANGYGVPQDDHEALRWFKRAADKGFAPAQNSLACCYELGKGVKIDFKTAAQWYTRAAEQGLQIAQFNLGRMFYIGNGVSQLYEEAVRWLRLAAAQGDAGALYILGTCYGNGLGVPQDGDEALRSFKRAAAKGHAGATAAIEQLRAQPAAARPG